MLISSIYSHSDIELLKKGCLNINGWIQQFRKQAEICFININDGSTPKGIQIVASKCKNIVLFDTLDKLNVGCYMKCYGKLIDSPAKGQKFEFSLEGIDNIGDCDILDYPLAKNIKLPSLRNKCHLRGRTKTFGCVFRIRNTVLYETHNFWQSKSFLNLDPNIITTNECEGGAGVFTVTELMNPKLISKGGDKNDFSKDHFSKQTFLTVSSQLQLEALCCGMGNCYTMNKSFRAEHSMTNKHMSEFTHLEIEMMDCNNNDLMDISKEYILYIINKVYEKNYDDIVELNKFTSKGLLEKYEKLRTLKFFKITYDDCINVIKKNSKIKCEYGDDLSSEMEEFITSFYGGAVFVYDWVMDIKSFYMKHKDNNNDNNIEEYVKEPVENNEKMEHSKKLCENFDLLMPFGIGELIGGSMREYREKYLLQSMDEKGVSTKGLEWYIDLRKFGTVQHGGFGLGMDRLIMIVSGMSNIKDVVPYPVSYQNCNY